jgi:hypothetical protein
VRERVRERGREHKKATAIFSRHPEGPYNLDRERARKGGSERESERVREHKKATAIFPRHPEGLYNLGLGLRIGLGVRMGLGLGI